MPKSRSVSPWIASCLLALCLALSAGALWADEKEEAAKPTLEDLEFMAGCWQGSLGQGAVIRETFTSPLGGIMLGNSQMVAGGATQFFEMVRVTEDESGIKYHPAFDNQETAVAFTLTKLDEAGAVFENPQHDFPQRIVYSSPSPGKLVARIELMNGEKAQGFSMEAIPCGGESYRAALQ